MPSKKLIAEVSYRMAIADAYGESPIPDPSRFRRHAEAAISTILAALQEPTEGMKRMGVLYTDWPGKCWRPMLSASALGEQSE